ncbi:hypothetical protein [Flavobacterium sp.]|uniref:hypothetical protein n=1 Tax=Flavobacterium sp. TaxID=239 RepID=UPI003751EFEF
MIVFTKNDLFYTDYQWTIYASDSPKLSGKLDATKFNKNEGFEVLYFINKLIHLWDFTKQESCIKIERILREHLPKSVITQEDTATWVQINWKTISFTENS